MTLMNPAFDFKHYDAEFAACVRIIDTTNGKDVALTYCNLRRESTPDTVSHSELLAGDGAKLKQLIVKKSEACVARKIAL